MLCCVAGSSRQECGLVVGEGGKGCQGKGKASFDESAWEVVESPLRGREGSVGKKGGWLCNGDESSGQARRPIPTDLETEQLRLATVPCPESQRPMFVVVVVVEVLVMVGGAGGAGRMDGCAAIASSTAHPFTPPAPSPSCQLSACQIS